MGLAERRAIKDFQDKHLATLTADIQAAAGFAVPIEVSWEQLAEDGQSSNYEHAWTEIFFKPVTDALRSITRDQMGKDALKAALKKIEFRNAAGNYSPGSAITFADGVITFDHSLSNIDYTGDRTTHLVEILEKGL